MFFCWIWILVVTIIVYFQINGVFCIDVKSILEDCSDNSVVNIPSGFYLTDGILIQSKKNVEIITDGLVVLECANPSIMNPEVDTWTLNGDFYVKSSSFTQNSCSQSEIYASIGTPVSSLPNDLSVFTERRQLWTYTTFDTFLNSEVGEGVYFNTSTLELFISLENEENPNELLSSNNEMLYISCGKCIEIDDSTNISISNIDPFIIDNGGKYGLYIDGGEGIHLSNIHIYGALSGIWFINLVKRSGIQDSLIRNFPQNDEWYWGDFKSEENTAMEASGVYFAITNKDNYIINCEVSGFFNGIVSISGESFTLEECNENLVIENNRVHNIKDDALELEFCNVNVRVFGNIVYDSYTSLSLAPLVMGPVYVYQNLLIASKTVPYHRIGITINSPKVFKFINSGSSSPPENVKLYHNTVIGLYGKVLYGNPDEDHALENIEFYNNIFKIIYSSSSGLPQWLIRYTGLSTSGNRYDYNIHYAEDFEPDEDQSLYQYYNGWVDTNGYDTLDEVLESSQGQSSGYDQMSKQADPEFSLDDLNDPRDYSLPSSSPAYECAVIVDETWPLDNILQNMDESKRHIGCYGILVGNDIHNDDDDDVIPYDESIRSSFFPLFVIILVFFFCC